MTDPHDEQDWADKRAAARQALPEALVAAGTLPAVLLPYQARLLAMTAREQFVVCEKSRRIGMTWGVGADAVLTAGAARTAGGMDVLYIGYNLDMAREFIDVCAMWAKAFVGAASAVQEFIFKDQSEDGQDKDITAFRIRFASGFEIVALTSKPRSLRGRQGFVIFDEAAFHDELGALIKAAMALTMWGGKVLVISTHDGQDNPFHELIQDIRAGKRQGVVLRVTFDDAIADGLYERIAMVKGLDAGPKAKADWIGGVLGMYGDDAGEELHVIPAAGTGVYISGAAIDACMDDSLAVARLTCPAGFELRPMPERRKFVDEWLDTQVAPFLAQLDPARRSCIGEDFGRTIDLTVIAVGQEQQNLDVTVPLIVELANCPIEQQKQVLRFIWGHLARFGGAKFDATGNGLGLAEWAQEEVGHEAVEAVKISATWWLENGPKLRGHVQDQTIRFARDADIKDDIRALRLKAGIPGLGNTRKEGRHGDAAVALIMLLAAFGMEVEEYDFTALGARSRWAAPDRDDGDDQPGGGRFGRGAW